MAHVLEHAGRLLRGDGREVASGSFDLCFRLHLGADGAAFVWEESHDGVSVSGGGHYAVLLGATQPFDEATFAEPRWLGVYVCRGGTALEVGGRVPLAGASVRLHFVLEALHDRVTAAETLSAGRFTSRENVDPEARERLVKVHRRLKRVERATEGAALVTRTVADLRARMLALDEEEGGRVTLIEDELRDIVGSDGDLIDMQERIEALERGHGGPMRLAGLDELEARVAAAERFGTLLQRNLDALSRALELVANQPAARAPAPSADQLAGPVTIQRGGLHVAGGGLVVHDIEGRLAGASKRDGPLLVNSKSGADLVVGNKSEGSVVASGSVRAGRAGGVPRAVGVRMAGEGLAVGDVVAYEARKKGAIVRRAQAGEPPFGVVAERAALELGEGAVLVAVSGVVSVRVEGEVAAGDWLVAGDDGAARVGNGPGIGRALTAAAGGRIELRLHGN
jgi:hypothetical protein